MRERILTVLAVLAVAFILPLAAYQTPDAEAQAVNEWYREVVFSADAVIDEDTAGTAYTGFAPATLAAFSISCVEDSGTATLDVAIQRSVDGGATWADIVAFTQLSATGAETKLYADVRAASAQMIGDRLRAEFDVGGTGQYTCDVTGALEA